MSRHQFKEVAHTNYRPFIKRKPTEHEATGRAAKLMVKQWIKRFYH
jgi:hypothetical protein